MEQEQLHQALEKLDAIAKTDPEDIRKKVWSSMSIIVDLILRAKDANFQSGWAAKVVDHEGKPIFSREECTGLEATAIAVVKPMFFYHDLKKHGGALTDEQQAELEAKVASLEVDLVKANRSIKEKMKEKADAVKQYMKTMTPEKAKAAAEAAFKDFSLDSSYFKAKKVIADVDAQALEYAKDGPLKLIYADGAQDIPIPNPWVPGLKVNPRGISTVITVLLEVVRLLFSFGPLSSDTTRKVTSLLVTVLNVMQGDWKYAILSGLGLFGQATLVIGVLGKLMLSVFRSFGPTNQDALLLSIFKSTKSMPIGFILWSIITFAPDEVRDTIDAKFQKIGDIIRKAVEDINAKTEDETKKIKLKALESDLIPSMANVQAIQAIASNQAIVCSQELQTALQEATKDNIFVRILVELCNIPLDPDMILVSCPSGIEPLEKSVNTYISSL